jgi:hypothetical protein
LLRLFFLPSFSILSRLRLPHYLTQGLHRTGDILYSVFFPFLFVQLVVLTGKGKTYRNSFPIIFIKFWSILIRNFIKLIWLIWLLTFIKTRLIWHLQKFIPGIHLILYNNLLFRRSFNLIYIWIFLNKLINIWLFQKFKIFSWIYAIVWIN